MSTPSPASDRPRVYLAGPDVFLPDALEVGEAKKRVCEEHGLVGVFPLDGPYERLAGLTGHHAGLVAFDICVELMNSCDLGIANMTPFRGPSMDIGTAVEMGYLYAQGKPVFGYTNSSHSYRDRVAPDGVMVEPFDLCDNLMAPGTVHRSTGILPVQPPTHDEPPPIGALHVFTECVRHAAAHLARA